MKWGRQNAVREQSGQSDGTQPRHPRESVPAPPDIFDAYATRLHATQPKTAQLTRTRRSPRARAHRRQLKDFRGLPSTHVCCSRKNEGGLCGIVRCAFGQCTSIVIALLGQRAFVWCVWDMMLPPHRARAKRRRRKQGAIVRGSWTSLSSDIWSMALQFLSTERIAKVAAACKLFQRLSVARDSYHTVRLSSLTTPWQDWARRDRVRSRLAAASPALADASVSATILDLIFAVRVSPAMLCAILRGGASRDRRRGVACVPVAVQQG